MTAINLTTDMMGEVIMKNQDGLMRIIDIGDKIANQIGPNLQNKPFLVASNGILVPYQPEYATDPLFVANPNQTVWR